MIGGFIVDVRINNSAIHQRFCQFLPLERFHVRALSCGCFLNVSWIFHHCRFPFLSVHRCLCTCCRCGQVEPTELEQQRLETQRADRSVFVQELLLSSLTEGLRLSDSSSESGGSDNELYPNAMGAPASRPDRNSPNNPSHNKIKQRDITSMPPDKAPPPHIKQS